MFQKTVPRTHQESRFWLKIPENTELLLLMIKYTSGHHRAKHGVVGKAKHCPGCCGTMTQSDKVSAFKRAHQFKREDRPMSERKVIMSGRKIVRENNMTASWGGQERPVSKSIIEVRLERQGVKQEIVWRSVFWAERRANAKVLRMNAPDMSRNKEMEKSRRSGQKGRQESGDTAPSWKRS